MPYNRGTQAKETMPSQVYNFDPAVVMNHYANAGGNYWDISDVPDFIHEANNCGAWHENADAAMNFIIEGMMEIQAEI